MIVVAKVKNITQHLSSETENPYNLEENERYF